MAQFSKTAPPTGEHSTIVSRYPGIESMSRRRFHAPPHLRVPRGNRLPEDEVPDSLPRFLLLPVEVPSEDEWLAAIMRGSIKPNCMLIMTAVSCMTKMGCRRRRMAN